MVGLPSSAAVKATRARIIKVAFVDINAGCRLPWEHGEPRYRALC